jgi:hypothetical protein
MVPVEFTGYFTAAAAAAGVLIGLLFVAVALRPDSVFSQDAPPAGRAIAGSAFIGLVDSFFVSLVALIPHANLGEVATIMAVISLLSTIQLHRRVARQELHIVMLVLGLGIYLFQLVIGVLLLLDPADRGQVSTAAYLVIAAFGVALSRAWKLMQGKHLAAPPAGQGQAATQSP